MARADHRSPGDLRLTRITPHFQLHPEGSVLIEVGNTRVICSAMIEEAVWGFDFDSGTNVVDVYIGLLRRKLEAGGEPRLIHTVRSVGYVLRGPACDGPEE